MDKLGKIGRDKVSGLEGHIIGKTSYLFGCHVYGLQAPAEGGKIPDAVWVDEGRVEIVGQGVAPADVQTEKPGGMGMRSPNNRVR